MCMIDDADGKWDVLHDQHHKAIKDHRCSECGRTIAKGETYSLLKVADEYGITVYKQCLHCERAASWLVVTCNGYLIHGVLEDLVEHWDESWDLRSLWLGRAIIGCRRRWERRDRTGLMEPLPKWDVEVAA